jgi:predicted phosphodiesterase
LALEAVLADIKRNKIDQIIILGDLITDFPQETNNMLNIVKKAGNYIIQGNRENNIIYKKEQYEYDQFSTTLLTYDQISNKNFKFITLLPKQISITYDKSFSIRCVHGTPFSLVEHIFEDDDSIIIKSLNAINENILLCGHTHRQWYKRVDEKMILNHGSVGINVVINRRNTQL